MDKANETKRTAIGPRGVLPPGEWAEGAKVDYMGHRGLLLGIDGDRAFVRHFYTEGESGMLEADTTAASVALDLRTGPIDFGTRALLHLVAPEVAQPLCAPSWERFGRQWTLTVRHGDGWESKWRFTEHGVYHASTRVMDTPDGLLDIEDPRLALVAALEKASER